MDGGIQQEQCVAPVHEGVGGLAVFLRDGGAFVQQRVVGDGLDDRGVDDRLLHAKVFGDPAGLVQLDGMALAVLEGDGLDVARAELLQRQEETGGRVLPAGEDHGGFLGG